MKNDKRDKNKLATTEIEPGAKTRLTALRLLGAVVDKATSLDGLTDNEHGHPHYLSLDPRDRALVRAMLGAALRHRGDIDATLENFLDRPLPENAKALRHLIHIAAAQIIYLDVPDHAAINLAVSIAKNDPRLARFSGLVNALLRRFTRERETILSSTDPLMNVPRWFGDMLENAYGREKAQAIIKAQYHEPPLDLTVRNNAHEWAEKLSGIALTNDTVRLPGLDGPLIELDGFNDGQWWVQDVAASLPARLMGDIAGKYVADLCAAPGGKTAQLAAQGAFVTAVDLSASRMKRLIANMARLQFEVEHFIGNLKDYAPDRLFDAVLLDAPCSSTGTIRRHPDVLWTKTPDDVAKLARLQAELLARAVEVTKPGGVIVFSNCSLSPVEGEELVDSFLKTADTVTLSPITADEVSGLGSIVTNKGYLRTTPTDLPNDNPRLAGMDGFFAARFIRNQ